MVEVAYIWRRLTAWMLVLSQYFTRQRMKCVVILLDPYLSRNTNGIEVFVISVDVVSNVLARGRLEPALPVGRRVTGPVVPHSRIVAGEVTLSTLRREHWPGRASNTMDMVIMGQDQRLLRGMVKQTCRLSVGGELKQSLPTTREEPHLESLDG